MCGPVSGSPVLCFFVLFRLSTSFAVYQIDSLKAEASALVAAKSEVLLLLRSQPR